MPPHEISCRAAPPSPYITLDQRVFHRGTLRGSALSSNVYTELISISLFDTGVTGPFEHRIGSYLLGGMLFAFTLHRVLSASAADYKALRGFISLPMLQLEGCALNPPNWRAHSFILTRGRPHAHPRVY